jgi:hypothetical protein
MVVEDIGYMLFVEFLRMSQYPGAPFTGEIMRDIVMFFFIPTVFIIVVVYMLLGRVLATAHTKLRLLFGIAIYAFIIFGGYYSVFAYLAGPYFIFLIFIMGILYYFIEHFRRRQEGVGGGSGTFRSSLGSGEYPVGDKSRLKKLLGVPDVTNPVDVKELRKTLDNLNNEIKSQEKFIEDGLKTGANVSAAIEARNRYMQEKIKIEEAIGNR